MQRVAMSLTLGLVWIFAAAAQAVEAQDPAVPTRVEEIRLDPQAFAGEVRTLEGVVDRLVARDPPEEPAFYLEDDFGHQILVIPLDGPPLRGDRVRVTGVVSVDAAGDPRIAVFEDGGLTAAAAVEDGAVGAAPGVSPRSVPGTGEQPDGVGARGRSPLFWGALLAAAFAVLLGAYFRGRASVAPGLIMGPSKNEPDIATSALWPESEQTFDGRTMRFSRPDPTVRLMSAKLEVIGGADAGEEIRFVGVPDEPVEMMIGRSPGTGPGSVELKQKTVSRTHAVVRNREGSWFIENLSTTNPTVLNGEVLGVKERSLVTGDRIELGEVVFRFVE